MGVAGDRIKHCRLACRMTQDDVARYLGIAKQTVYKYEVGIIENIPLSVLEHLASLFGVSPEYLAGWKNEIPQRFVLREDESQLIKTYRSLPGEGKHLLLKQAQANQIMFELTDNQKPEEDQ